MGVTEFAGKLGVSPRRARALCLQGRVRGAYQSGGIWIIPADAVLTPGRSGPELRIARAQPGRH